MMILQALGARQSFAPFWRAGVQIHAQIAALVHAFVWGRLIAFNSGDPRWTIVAIALRLLCAALAFGERQLALWARSVLRRAWQGARFAAHSRTADSMVAAGGR
jgi:hypothetical protein